MEGTPTPYVAYYFETPEGRCPSAEFIDSLDPDAQRKFFAKRRLLEEFGPKLPAPHAKHLRQGIHELRFSGREAGFRILYFFDGSRIMFTNGFKKQTQKTPRREIALAIQRRNLYMERKR